jgi:hypothetical protein
LPEITADKSESMDSDKLKLDQRLLMADQNSLDTHQQAEQVRDGTVPG